jgi:hypothetical protein
MKNNNKLLEEISRFKEICNIKSIDNNNLKFLNEAIGPPVNQILKKLIDLFEEATIEGKGAFRRVGTRTFTDEEHKAILNKLRDPANASKALSDIFSSPQTIDLLLRIVKSESSFVDDLYGKYISALIRNKSIENSNQFPILIFKGIGRDSVDDITVDMVKTELRKYINDEDIVSIFAEKVLKDLEGVPEIISYSTKASSKKLPQTAAKFDTIFGSTFPRFNINFWKNAAKNKAVIEQNIEDILSIIARNIEEGKNAQQDFRVLIDYVISLRKSTGDNMKEAFRKNLTENKIVTYNKEEWERFLKENPHYNKIFDDAASDYQKEFVRGIGEQIGAMFGRVIEGEGVIWSGIKRNLWNIAYQDFRTPKELMYVYARRGPKAVIWGKIASFIIIHQVLFPLMAAAIASVVGSIKIQSMNKEIEEIRKKLCIEKQVLSKEDCDKLKEIPVDLYNRFFDTMVSYSDVSVLLGKTPEWNNLLFFTHIDEIYRFVVLDVFYTQTGTQEGLTKDFWLNKFNEKSKELQEWQSLGYDSTKSTEENVNFMVAKATEKQKREEMIKRVVESSEGFQAWADLNGYTIITPYDPEGGIGVAHKKDDKTKTPINFEWDKEYKIFKELKVQN